jgi:hypothetical protein
MAYADHHDAAWAAEVGGGEGEAGGGEVHQDPAFG